MSYCHVDGIIRAHSLARLARTLNRMEPLLMLIVTPVLFQVKMSCEEGRGSDPSHFTRLIYQMEHFTTLRFIYGPVPKAAVCLKDAVMSLPSVS